MSATKALKAGSVCSGLAPTAPPRQQGQAGLLRPLAPPPASAGLGGRARRRVRDRPPRPAQLRPPHAGSAGDQPGRHAAGAGAGAGRRRSGAARVERHHGLPGRQAWPHAAQPGRAAGARPGAPVAVVADVPLRPDGLAVCLRACRQAADQGRRAGPGEGGEGERGLPALRRGAGPATGEDGLDHRRDGEDRQPVDCASQMYTQPARIPVAHRGRLAPGRPRAAALPPARARGRRWQGRATVRPAGSLRAAGTAAAAARPPHRRVRRRAAWPRAGCCACGTGARSRSPRPRPHPVR